MAFIKYSIGGQITSVEDKDSVEAKEIGSSIDKVSSVVVCNKCGLQHALRDGNSKSCSCGNKLQLN